jgi:phosphoserine phosphatase RsbU/P
VIAKAIRRFWRQRRLATKILLVFLPLLLVALVAIAGVAAMSLSALGTSAVSTTASLGARTRDRSDATLRAYSQANLAALAADQASISDAVFARVGAETELLASYASSRWGTPSSDVASTQPLPVLVELIAPDADADGAATDLQETRKLAELFMALRAHEPNLDAVYIGTSHGVIAGTGRGVVAADLPVGLDPRVRPWYQAAIGVDQLIWTTPYVSARSGHSLNLTAARRVTDASGRPVAVVALDLIDTMAEQLGSAVLRKHGYAFVLDAQANMVVSPSLTAAHTSWDQSLVAENLLASDSPSVRDIAARMVAGESGVGAVRFADGERFVSYAPLRTTGWSIGLVVPPEEVTSLAAQMDELIAELTQMTRALLAAQGATAESQFAALVVLIMLIAGGGAVMLARTITRRVERLNRAARELEAGTLSDEEVGVLRETEGGDEVASLMRAFARTAVGVKARETELRQQVQELHIEIDRAKAAEEIAEITESDYFKDLQTKARAMREPRNPPSP